MGEPITQRETLAGVQKELNKLEASKKKATPSAGFNEEDDGGNAGVVVGVIAAALAIGGIIYCKCNKKCCFEEKEDLEGGQRTDRTLFKKEVKSKNSHKRHTKESLVPAFKVAEEEA